MPELIIIDISVNIVLAISININGFWDAVLQAATSAFQTTKYMRKRLSAASSALSRYRTDAEFD